LQKQQALAHSQTRGHRAHVAIAPSPIALRSCESRLRYGVNHNAVFFLYYPGEEGGGAGICLVPPPLLTGFNPPPLASFTGSKSRFGFSRSVFETCFFLFIFRLPFCCCEPHLNRPSAHSLDFYYHGARHTKKKSILASWIFD
jgi:hypothetical protein